MVAIDRDARRFKLDKEFKEVMLTFRERMDIADFDLQTFASTQLSSHKNFQLIAIAKHLCGGATDLALTSMSLQDKKKTLVVCIATCCHQCCDARTYVNMPYLKTLLLTEEDIEIMPRFSSWAICLQVKAQMRRVGFKVKRILDFGRCLFIEDKLEMEVTPYQYCDPLKESPENILLLATKKK